MDDLPEAIELRLSQEFFRICIILAIGVLVLGFAGEGVAIWVRHLDGMSAPVSLFPPIASVALAVSLFTLGMTWRLRVLPSGVEIRYLFMSRLWEWQDFGQAEAGHYQMYFPQLPLWKRYLNVNCSEAAEAEKAWNTILAHVPPGEKWIGPLTFWSQPLARLTFFGEGVRARRLFREEFLPWDELESAIVFRPPFSNRGFGTLRLFFRGRAFQLDKFRTLRRRGKKPADYDVLDLLAAHMPKENLVVCASSGPAASIEEAKERKKVAVRARRAGLVIGFCMSAYILFLCCQLSYNLLTQWQLMRGYWAFASIVFGVMLSGGVLYLAVAIQIWRQSRKEEEQMAKDTESLVSGIHPE